MNDTEQNLRQALVELCTSITGMSFHTYRERYHLATKQHWERLDDAMIKARQELNEPKTLSRPFQLDPLSRQEIQVAYYEQLHADARTAIESTAKLSIEMRERLIEAKAKLERMKEEAAK